MAWFLFFSLLSGTLELGTVFLSWAQGARGWSLLLMPLMYQMGNLLFYPRAFTVRRAKTLCWAALTALAANVCFPCAVLFALQVLLSSLLIQAVRAGQKGHCSTWLKRCFRIAGFLLAPLTVAFPVPAVAVGTLLPAAALLLRPVEPRVSTSPPRIVLTMVLHQMHYFVYAYLPPVLVYSATESATAGAAAFALTWVVYLLPQTVAERQHSFRPQRMFFICHGFLALMMAAMTIGAACGCTFVLLAAWILTGLGGGSVFCIRSLTDVYRETDMTFSENLGHVAGVTAAIALLLPTERNALPFLCGASFLLVCFTLLTAYTAVASEAKTHGELH